MTVPSQLICVRHGQSLHNNLMHKKQRNHDYIKLKNMLDKHGFGYPPLWGLATQISKKYNPPFADKEADLTWLGRRQSLLTAQALKNEIALPDVVVVSPFRRCVNTFEAMKLGWPELENVKFIIQDERIREQETGEAYLRGDLDVFFILNPAQHELFRSYGRYFYRFPSGENVPDIRLRLHVWFDDLRRKFPRKRILIISHFTTLISFGANLNDWSEEEFLVRHENTRLTNCSVTVYDAVSEETYKSKYFNRVFHRI